MIENRTARYKRKKRRYNLLTSDGPFPGHHNILQFYAGGDRGEILDRISQHLQNCDEPVVVRGEHGSGKTLLSLVLADRLKKKFFPCRYDFPTFSRAALLRYLISRIRPEHRIRRSQTERLTEADQQIKSQGGTADQMCGADDGDLAELLAVVRQAGKIVQPILLIIDTAADIDSEVFELLQELKKISINGCSLFRVVVFELDNSVYGALQEQAHLIQNNALPYKTFTLRRLSLAEIHGYLQHHMLLFDYSQRNMFSHEMSYFIADRSEGVYGRINELARSAFLLAGINNSSQVSLSHLIAVGSPQRDRSRRASRLRYIHSSGVRFAILVMGIIVLGAALVVFSANQVG